MINTSRVQKIFETYERQWQMLDILLMRYHVREARRMLRALYIFEKVESEFRQVSQADQFRSERRLAPEDETY